MAFGFVLSEVGGGVLKLSMQNVAKQGLPRIFAEE